MSRQVALTSAHTARTGADTQGEDRTGLFTRTRCSSAARHYLPFRGKIKCFFPEGAWSLEPGEKDRFMVCVGGGEVENKL